MFKILCDQTRLVKKIEIIMDNREPTEIMDMLKNMGADVTVKQLELGDFLVSKKTVIERKTKQDFEQSIIDQRLFRQLNNLTQWYDNVIVILEGTEPYMRLRKEAIRGAYAAIITDFKCSLFFTRNKRATSEIVYAMAKHEQLAKKITLTVMGKRKRISMSDRQRAIIEALPMIGPQLTLNLLNHFKSVSKILNADIEQLMQVEGIGKIKARQIIHIINKEYGEGSE